MKKTLICIIIIASFISCSFIKERIAIKECKFSLIKVKPYDFSYSNMKLDFDIQGDNPNKIDAVLDRLSYTFIVNDKDVFTGTTGKNITIPAGKSTDFTTTISLKYSALGDVIVSAIKLGNASYKVKATAYISTVIGEISYPVEISLN